MSPVLSSQVSAAPVAAPLPLPTSTATPAVMTVSALFSSGAPATASLCSRLAPVHPVDPTLFRTAHRLGTLTVPAIPPSAVHGTLYFDYRSMVCVALRRQEHPAESVSDLIRWLLSRGIAFVWRVPVPHSVTAVLSPLDGPPFAGPPASLAAYEASVRAVLQRLHARHWLQCGGLAWRLALHYGPADLLDHAVSSPSSRTTALSLGTGRDVPVLSISNVTSVEEDTALIGRNQGTSVWPNLLLWESSVMWTREWSTPAEYWFMRRVANLVVNREVFLTDRLWRHQLHRIMQSHEYTISAEHGSDHRALELVSLYADAARVAMVPFS